MKDKILKGFNLIKDEVVTRWGNLRTIEGGVWIMCGTCVFVSYAVTTFVGVLSLSKVVGVGMICVGLYKFITKDAK